MLQKKKENLNTNRYPLRIADQDIIKWIDEIAKTNVFRSKNEILNHALRLSIPIIYKDVFDRNRVPGRSLVQNLDESDKTFPVELLEKKIKEMSFTTDEMFVVLNIIEYLITNLFNIELAKINGQSISDAEIRNGLLSNLPANLQRVKDEMINRQRKGR